MEVAKIRVDGAFANVVERRAIPSGLTGGTILVEYAPGIWDNLSKTVVFRGVITKDVITQEYVVEIPWETVAAPNKRLQVGFYGVNAAGEQIIPTLWADLGLILPGADPSGDASTDPSLPVWAQLADRIDDLQDQVDNMTPGGGSGGGVNFKPDETLRLENGILSVNTIDKVIEDDARPITSGAVYNEFSMAVALLKTI